uniref:AP2/ERF domain-containing protein n=1 Tax=Bicosoecida sp. CB-2014 TaxID=1486930 RepID=A0A7S1CI92_9STRA
MATIFFLTAGAALVALRKRRSEQDGRRDPVFVRRRRSAKQNAPGAQLAWGLSDAEHDDVDASISRLKASRTDEWGADVDGDLVISSLVDADAAMSADNDDSTKDGGDRGPQWVDTVEGLERMVAELARHKVIGVDVEQHGRHSFQGVCCTLQLSVPGHDWVVDALALPPPAVARHLRPIFTNGAIIKVMHGCNNDLMWLQRDWGIRVVNLFDTSVAARELGRPNVSLAVLLRDFGVTMSASEKHTFQAADWRLRPLSDDMLRYARDDSRYMVRLRARLIASVLKRNGAEAVADVLQRCDDMCLKRYEVAAVPTVSDALRSWVRLSRSRRPAARHLPESWTDTAAHAAPSASAAAASSHDDGSRSMAALMKWRDHVARTNDASVKAVSPLDLLFDIAVAAAAHRNVFAWVAAAATSGSPAPPAPLELLIAATGLNREALPRLLVGNAQSAVAAVSDASKLPELPVRGGAGGDADGEGERMTSASAREAMKAKRYEKFKERYSVSKPVYSNCRLLRPDGTLLTFCDINKIKWYLVRKIATLEPGTGGRVARLNFEPNSPDGSGEVATAERKSQPYYDNAKRNQCVRCGGQKHLLRYSIVPRLYRTHMPERFKSHRSHDIVLLCMSCQNEANKAEAQLTAEITEEYGVPLDGGPELDWMRELSNNARSARGAATALMKNGDKLPDDRVEALRDKVQRYFAGIGAGDDDIDELIRRGVKLEGPDVSSAGRWTHGRAVIIKVAAAGELEDFIKRWRRHFVATVRPAHMPPQWDVDHAVVRSFGVRSKFYRGDDAADDAAGDQDRISQYRGVEWDATAEKWQASLWHKRKERVLGQFDSEEDAAKRYDDEVLKLFGHQAVTNFEPK